MMSVAVRDLHRCYPGRFVTSVETTAPDIWLNNPHVVPVNRKKRQLIKLGYPLIKQSNQCGLHFAQGFIDDLNRKLNLKVRLTEFRADLHFSEEERTKPLIEGPYWLILSGGKADFTTKWWDARRHQEVIDRLHGKVAFVQIGNKPDGGGARHYHPALSGVINLVGKTRLRDAFRLLLHARGIVCPVTCFMHAAAAIGKPAVVIAGGLEHWTWEAYNEETLRRNLAFAAGHIRKLPGSSLEWNRWSPYKDRQFVDHPFVPHVFFSAVGKLDCCARGGCWKTKVTEGKRREQNCIDVIRAPDRQPLPRCMDMITSDDVVGAVLAYEAQIEKGERVPTVKDLVINLPNVDAPPPPEETLPMVAHDAEKPKVKALSSGPKTSTASANGNGIHVPSRLKFTHFTFPITVCALTYGRHNDLAMRCLSSLYQHMPVALFKLRFGMNDVPDDAANPILAFLEDKPNVERVYKAQPQIYKYPMMRRMFYDEELPLSTDWVMWLDDDSHVMRSDFAQRIGTLVDAFYDAKSDVYPNGYRCFGKVYYWHLRGKQWDWVKRASWYSNRQFPKDKSKRPPMDKIDFCTGGAWLITRSALMDCDWPDPRLRHRGGDIMLGAALYQRGYGMTQGDSRGRFHDVVRISDAKKRGFDEPIAGT